MRHNPSPKLVISWDLSCSRDKLSRYLTTPSVARWSAVPLASQLRLNLHRAKSLIGQPPNLTSLRPRFVRGSCMAFSRRPKKPKLRNHLEGSRRDIDGFCSLVDERGRSVADESCALANVHDSAGVESHQTRAGCIRSYRIVRKHNHSQRTRRAVKGTVSFHCDNAVRDNEADWNCCAQIEDALLNALPVGNILRPRWVGMQ